MNTSVFMKCGETEFRRIVRGLLPDAPFNHILIKPNWVMHEKQYEFPIRALVTSTELIEAVVDTCLEKYPNAEWITVGDVPLQNCEFGQLISQAGIDRLIRKYASVRQPRVRFLDLRRERFKTRDGFHVADTDGESGDPCGYREVRLDDQSFLEAISTESDKFRVSDYSPEETTSSHHKGSHRYLVAGSTLDCDLFINLPKMKVHQKAGITGALKNLVGINGNKSFLVHFQHGKPAQGGDEFPPNNSNLVLWQTRIRDLVQKRSPATFSFLRPGWTVLKRLGGIQTVGTRENLNDTFYISGGSWYGNDTIWRMVYDLNRIIRYASGDGTMQNTPQRTYVAIVDGIVAGEGNGPLQPLPVDARVVIGGDDPFLIDMAMAQLMGFDYRCIPLLANHHRFGDPRWGDFDPDTVEFNVNGANVRGLPALPIVHHFLPAPGWRGHIELQQTTANVQH